MKATIRKWLTEQFGEDENLFADLYGQYSADMKRLAAELKSTLANGDAQTLGDHAHAMKGMALQMGDSELADPCFALQNLGRSGELVGCEPLIQTILARVAAL